MTSPDGIVWTAQASAADNDWVAIAWSSELGLFAAVATTGTGNQVMISPDGVTWTSQASAENNRWRGIAWSPEFSLFAAVAATGTGNQVMTYSIGTAGSVRIHGGKTAITLAPDGRYEFINHNFYGSSDYYRMYGCDGKNRAFEFDGNDYIPIRTGMITDAPTHITAFKRHLFLMFPGGSVQHSSTGEPVEWSAITGASELGIGQGGTGFAITVGGTLAIFSRNGIFILSGTGASDWILDEYSRELGAIEWSLQKMMSPMFLDDVGLTSMDAVPAFGDFKANTLSQKIQSYFTSAKRNAVVASLRIKSKEQYRLFFSDGTGINLAFNGNSVVGFTRLKYPDAITCTCSGEDSSGNEVLFFGSDDGMVYQFEKGTSFDGDAIIAYLKTSPNSIGTPDRKKRFFSVIVEKDNLETATEWEVGVWGGFKWSDPGGEIEQTYLDTVDTNYSFIYYSSSQYLEPFTLHGVRIHYSLGGMIR